MSYEQAVAQRRAIETEYRIAVDAYEKRKASYNRVNLLTGELARAIHQEAHAERG